MDHARSRSAPSHSQPMDGLQRLPPLPEVEEATPPRGFQGSALRPVPFQAVVLGAMDGAGGIGLIAFHESPTARPPRRLSLVSRHHHALDGQ